MFIGFMQNMKASQEILLLLLLAVGLSQSQRDNTNEDSKTQCKSIDEIPMCVGVGYHAAGLPNFRSQNDVNNINQELKLYDSLIKTNCSNALAYFLCSVYAPLCYYKQKNSVYKAYTLPPCRSLCEQADSECRATVIQQNYPWPPGPHLDCSKYPTKQDAKGMCFGPDDPSTLPPMKVKSKFSVTCVENKPHENITLYFHRANQL